MADKSISISILAKDLASGSLQKIGESAKHTAGELGKLGDNKPHLAMAAGLTAAAGGAALFATRSVDAFKDVATQTIVLQRNFGGTAESASRLRFEAQETGVSSETLGKSLKILSTHLANNDKAAKSLGFSYKDAHGNIMPFDKLLPEIADKFAKMPAGPEKSALAVKLFGKAGLDMLPMLNRGKIGLADLGKESDKFGLTMSGKNLQAVKDNTKNQRELNAAFEGVKVRLGQSLMPMFTKFTTFLAADVVPIVTKVTNFFGKYKGILVPIAAAIGTVVVATKIWTAATAAWTAVMDANPIGIVVVAVAALAAGLIYAYKHSETFRDVVKTTFSVISTVVDTAWNKVLKPFFTIQAKFVGIALDVYTFFGQGVVTVFKLVGDVIFQAIEHLLGMASHLPFVGHMFKGLQKDVEGWQKGFDGSMNTASTSIGSFRDNVNKAIDGITGDHVVHVNVRTAIGDAAQAISAPHKAGQYNYATGGPIFGPGSTTSDSIPIMASRDEHMWTAAEVAAAGGHSAVMRMRKAVLANAKGYAFGGPIIATNAGGAAAGMGGDLNRLVDADLQKMFGTMIVSAGAGVAQWAGLVAQVLGMLGLSPGLLGKVLAQMTTESGGNPGAINLTDSNAAAGHPSQGLMQVIPGTFAAYAGPYAGLGITNPLANIYAGLNYAMHRYGPGLAGLGEGHGYDSGGWLPTGVSVVHNNTGKPEPVLTDAQWQRVSGGDTYQVTVVNGTFTTPMHRRREALLFLDEISRAKASGTRLPTNLAL